MIFGKGGKQMRKELITIALTENEAVTMGQLVMEAISKRAYEPDNINIKWLWMLMETISEQMTDDEEEE